MNVDRKMGTARHVFAENLRRRRKQLGLSQETFAALVGVHRTYVGAVERCEKNITLDNIERFAIALECSIGDLLGEHDEP